MYWKVALLKKMERQTKTAGSSRSITTSDGGLNRKLPVNYFHYKLFLNCFHKLRSILDVLLEISHERMHVRRLHVRYVFDYGFTFSLIFI